MDKKIRQQNKEEVSPYASPIELSPQQEKEYLDSKKQKYQEGLKKLEEETGLRIMASLDITPLGIFPKLSLVQIPPNAKKTPEKTIR